MVSLPKGSDDWKLLHEDFESLQSQILEQCRLVKRRNQFPIYSNSRKAPLWIKVEEFGGYQSPEKLGIISDDTELVFVDSPNELGRTDDNNAYSFIVVPSSGFDFVCNPAQTIANVCSFQSHQFLVRKCEKVPRGVLLIPDIILNEVFRVSPKDEIDILASVSTALEFSGIIHYSVDGATCNFEAGKHLNETIIAAPNGIAVKSFANESSQIHRFKTPASLESNSFSEFISQTKHRMILFHGQSGCGKSKAVADAIQYLNYSSSYLFKIVYIDLMTTDLYINSDIDLFSTIIFDHADEYLQIESDAEDEVTRKYVNMCRYISELLSMHKTAKVVLVSRSSKAFSRLSSAFSLRFDYSFRLEASKGWSFDVNPEPLISVFGLEEAKSSLHRLILNPLQFYRVYAANNMDLHSRYIMLVICIILKIFSILMSGPTGSGKTHLALKFLEHHDIRFIHIHGPEILDKYVGSSEKGVRDIFTRARNLKPCVILFDEFDSLVPKRGSNQSGVTDRIVNQFLTELDGTEDRSGVFIIATTSRPDLIDKAIIRPGRIDQRIELSYPKIDEIKEVHFVNLYNFTNRD